MENITKPSLSRRQTIQGPASRPVVWKASAKYSWRKNETLLRSGKTKLQALSGKKRDLHGGRREAGARGGEQDPEEDRQQRRGTQGETPRGGGGQAQHQRGASTGQDHDTQTATRRDKTGRRGAGRRTGARAGRRAKGRTSGSRRRGGRADGQTGGQEDGGADGRAGGQGGRGRPVPPGAAAKGGGHDLTHGREPNQPRGVRATALPLPSHVGRRRLPHGNGQGAQAKATTKAAAHKTPLWTPIDLQG